MKTLVFGFRTNSWNCSNSAVTYLDYNATTPLAPEVFEAMRPYLERHHGNPSSIHAAGRETRAAIDDARDRIARLLGAKSHEIIFTSSGTESDNLAVIGLARQYAARGKRILTCQTEHHAVLHAAEALAAEGFDVEFLPVDEHGVLRLEALREALIPGTTLVSVMSANNETGTLQPVDEIAKLCHAYGALFHSDMVQSFGKQPVRVSPDGPNAISIAAHKFYGPPGCGILWLRAGVSIQKIQFGGFHENERRPGTENVAAIAGTAVAAELAILEMEAEQSRQAALRDRLWQGIASHCPEAIRNGHPTHTLANTLNVSFPGLNGESLIMALDLEGICVSSGSACMVGSILPSHVLLAMGIPPETAQATVRYSLGLGTTEAGIDHALAATARVVNRLKA